MLQNQTVKDIEEDDSRLICRIFIYHFNLQQLRVRTNSTFYKKGPCFTLNTNISLISSERRLLVQTRHYSNSITLLIYYHFFVSRVARKHFKISSKVKWLSLVE